MAIARREQELLEKAAFEDPNPYPTRSGATAGRRNNAGVATPAQRQAGDRNRQTPNDARSNERAKPRTPIPLSEIICHACGKKGHYRGSRECPKTPSSARIHAMGYESDQGEGENPDRQDEEEEIPFEGQEYDGDADIELADDDYDEHIGTGAIVASVHAACESGDEKTRIAQVAQLATTGESESDQKIANELVSSIKEQYESWGSGIKTTFCGPSAQQLKTSNQKTWASNSNAKPNQSKGSHPKTQIGHCPTAVLKINGVEALVCFDSGSELDAISPDFARAVGIKPITKENAINIHLAMKGSTSTTSYEVEVDLNLGDATIRHPLKVLNLDRWDVILGSYFCRHYNANIDYPMDTIRISDINIKTLSKDEEALTLKSLQGAQKIPQTAKISAITAEA